VGAEGLRYAKSGLSDLAPPHPFAILRAQFTPGQTVLDLGCGSGDIGAYLMESGVAVDGVEMDGERAAIAGTKLRRVVVGRVGEPLTGLDARYDAALLIDVVEHLADPRPVLAWAASVTDVVYAFIPNAAHWTVRAKILRGDWSYADTGIFDRDHLHFYDIETMHELVVGGGWRVTAEWPHIIERFPMWYRVLARYPALFARAMLMRLEQAN
jgi:SAM-dependent methyltransferase